MLQSQGTDNGLAPWGMVDVSGGDRPWRPGRGGGAAASKAAQRRFSGSKRPIFRSNAEPFSGATAAANARAGRIGLEIPAE